LYEIFLRDAIEKDLSIIYEIESMVYTLPWTFNFFRIILQQNPSLFLVATCKEKIIGYIVGEIRIKGNGNNPKNIGHILNFSVKPKFQGRGVGTLLLDELEKRFLKKGVKSAYLEVRESNKRAQYIYIKKGYQFLRTAKNYYYDEDGIIFTKRL
jgi:ribosomal-protein-alanine N-acetyltransferase